jgi:hypothetical protein
MKKIYLYLIAICLIGMACDKYEQPIDEEFPKTITPVLIAQGELYGNGDEGIPQQNIIITTSTEWHDLISKIKSRNDNITDSFTEIDIDFTQYQIIAVFDDIKGNGGWSIDIIDITEYADSIVVTCKNKETGNETRIITQPFQIVKIPTSSKNIIFYHDGNVPYQPCPCGEDRPMEKDYLQGIAYLFRDSIPKEMYHQIRAENSDAPDEIRWIIFNSKTGRTKLIIEDFPSFIDEDFDEETRNGRPPDQSDLLSCTICNLPDYAKEWTISQNGCKVYIEGIPYANCGGITLGFHFEYLLTRLERR